MSKRTFIDIHELSGMLSIPAPTLYRWSAERGDFPKPHKFGRRAYRWDLAEVERFIKSSQPETAEATK